MRDVHNKKIYDKKYHSKYWDKLKSNPLKHEKHKEKMRAYQKQYLLKNKERVHAAQKRSNIKNKDKITIRAKNSYDKRRLAVLNYYSKGKLECNCCGERIYKFLAIDHIDNRYGTGKEHRIRSGYALQDWIIRNNFPEGFQILCHNCNVAKGHDGVCPHKIM